MWPEFTLYEEPGGIRPEKLQDIVEHVEEEARMILPGIQALFGFQLIAVFNQRFNDLTVAERNLHLGALFCSALAVLCALAPAAFHRQALPNEISPFLAHFGSRLLSISLIPLALGTTIDLYVISRFVTNSVPTALVISLTFAFASAILWFAFPQLYRRYVKKRREALREGN